MKFYSRKVGRDGEKDYIDTNDFNEVYFEKDVFKALTKENNDIINIDVEYNLAFNEETEKISLKAETTINSNSIIKEFIIEEPYILVEQAAIAYYDEELLDDIDIIRKAKNYLLNSIKEELNQLNLIITGINIDVLGAIKYNNNTIGIIDNILINSDKTITAFKCYSVLDLTAINSAELIIYYSDNLLIKANILQIKENEDRQLLITIDNINIIEEKSIEYIKSSEFKSTEEYNEDRVKFISIEEEIESEFNSFDDLF